MKRRWRKRGGEKNKEKAGIVKLHICCIYSKVKGKVSSRTAFKAQRGSGNINLLFL
jgi:hypothetical protein